MTEVKFLSYNVLVLKLTLQLIIYRERIQTGTIAKKTACALLKKTLYKKPHHNLLTNKAYPLSKT